MESICQLPKIGDIKKAKDIGHSGRALYIWVICPICKQGRWVPLYWAKKKDYICQCQVCFGKNNMFRCHKKEAIQKRALTQSGKGNPQWKRGKITDSQGYIKVWVAPDSPYRSMAKGAHKAHVPEHRLVMAKYLGRYLESWEHVHHIDGIKSHNDIANLHLVNTHEHERHTMEKRLRIELQEIRSIVTEQKKEIRLLKWQIKELQKQVQYKLNMEIR